MSRIGEIKIITQKNKTNLGTVLFLHGAGDTGANILQWVKELVGDFSLPHIKFLFPTAPVRAYKPYNGENTHVWFNRNGIRQDAPEHDETVTSIGDEMKRLIQKEVNSGVPLNKIIVGGFSMGGALALQTAYRFTPGLGGVFALSSFLNENSPVYDALESNPSSTPLLMFHGDQDEIVPIEWGKATFEKLKNKQVAGNFYTINGMEHELERDELSKVISWITKIIVDK